MSGMYGVSAEVEADSQIERLRLAWTQRIPAPDHVRAASFAQADSTAASPSALYSSAVYVRAGLTDLTAQALYGLQVVRPSHCSVV